MASLGAGARRALFVVPSLFLTLACRGAAPVPVQGAPPDGSPSTTTVQEPTLQEASVATVDASVAVLDAAPDVVDAGAHVDARADARAKPVPTVAVGDDDDAPVGKHGDVCRLGERHGGMSGVGSMGAGRPVTSCGPGLSCCYPCGIQGCDWVCHTPQECALDSRRP